MSASSEIWTAGSTRWRRWYSGRSPASASRSSSASSQGEYCPGRFSLHLPSGPKLAGIAQRVLARASLTAAVVVVGRGPALRDTLADVYDALELPINIRAAGAVTDQRPDIGAELVAEAIREAVVERYGAVTA